MWLILLAFWFIALSCIGFVAQSPSATSSDHDDDDDPRYLDKISYRLTLYKLMEERRSDGAACHSEDDDRTSSELTEANTSSLLMSKESESEESESKESESEESESKDEFDSEEKYEFDDSETWESEIIVKNQIMNIQWIYF